MEPRLCVPMYTMVSNADWMPHTSHSSYQTPSHTRSGTVTEQPMTFDALKPMPSVYEQAFECYHSGCYQGSYKPSGKRKALTDAFSVPVRIMCGLMKRNVLTLFSYDKSCQAVADLCKSNSAAAKKYYKELYYKCNDLDARVEPSDIDSALMSNEWHNFCSNCSRLSILAEHLYHRQAQTASISCGEVASTEQQLRAYGERWIYQTGHYDINTMCFQPDACYAIRLGRLLQWNKVVMCPGDQLIEYSMAAWNLCEGDKALAESIYRKLYSNCMELDEQVAPIDAYPEGNPDIWKEFCHKSTQLLLLRQAFLETYGREPCRLIPPSDDEDEEGHRIPAPRKLITRLQPAKPQAARHDEFKGTPLLPDIQTPVNEEGCLCIVDDKTFGVFDSAANKLNGAYLAGNPLAASNKQYLEILAEDRFLLAITGVLPGGTLYLPMSGRNMIHAYRQAHYVSYPAGGKAAEQFLERLRTAIQEYDVENLINLVLIGVRNAVYKLQQLQLLCALYLSVKQMSFGLPIALTVNTSLYPGVSQRLVVPQNNYQQQCDTNQGPDDLDRVRRGASLNLASIPTLADDLFAEWDVTQGMRSGFFQM